MPKNFKIKKVPKSQWYSSKLKTKRKHDDSMRLTKSLSTIFPKALNTKLKFAYGQSYNNNSSGQLNLFHGNNIMHVGPATSYTGNTLVSYANSVPTGIGFLLSNNTGTGTGAVSPYSQYRVWASTIRATWVGCQSGAAVSQFEGVKLLVFPATTDGIGGTLNYNHATLNSMSFNTLCEQPHAKLKLSGHTNQTGRGTVIKNSMKTMTQFGYKFKSTMEANVNLDGQLTSGGLEDVAQTYNWVVLLTGSDGSGTITGDLQIEINYDVEFFNRNQPNSGVPS